MADCAQQWMAEASRQHQEWLKTGETHEHFAMRVKLGFINPSLRRDPERWYAEATRELDAKKRRLAEDDARRAAAAAVIEEAVQDTESQENDEYDERES